MGLFVLYSARLACMALVRCPYVLLLCETSGLYIPSRSVLLACSTADLMRESQCPVHNGNSSTDVRDPLVHRAFFCLARWVVSLHSEYTPPVVHLRSSIIREGSIIS